MRHELPVTIGDAFLLAIVDGRLHVARQQPGERPCRGRARPTPCCTTSSTWASRSSESRALDARGRPRAGIARRGGDGPARGDRRPGDAGCDRRPAARRRARRCTSTTRPSPAGGGSKSAAELAGIRRAQAAAEAGLAAAAARAPRGASADGDRLMAGGEPLTAEAVRAALRDACRAHGAPAPADVIVAVGLAGVRPRAGLGPAAREPADRDRPLAAGRRVRLLGRHDADVRRRRDLRRGAGAGGAGADGARARARGGAPGDHRHRAARAGLRRVRGGRAPHAAHRAGRGPGRRLPVLARATASGCPSTRTRRSAWPGTARWSPAT